MTIVTIISAPLFAQFLGSLLDNFLELGQAFYNLCTGMPILLLGLGGLTKAFLVYLIQLEIDTLKECLVQSIVCLAQLTNFCFFGMQLEEKLIPLCFPDFLELVLLSCFVDSPLSLAA